MVKYTVIKTSVQGILYFTPSLDKSKLYNVFFPQKKL